MKLESLLENIIEKAEDLKIQNVMVLEGHHLVRRYVEGGHKLLSVTCVPSSYEQIRQLTRGQCSIEVKSEPEMGKFLGFPFHRGVIALAQRPQIQQLSVSDENLAKPQVVVGCPWITDEANLGAILRTVWALGVKTVLLGKRSADPFSRKTLRTSMGASFCLTLYYAEQEDWRGLRDQGFTLSAASVGSRIIPLREFEPNQKQAVIFGHETEGVPAEILDLCSNRVGIPMKNGADSLNVAVSAGIILYEVMQKWETKRECLE